MRLRAAAVTVVALMVPMACSSGADSTDPRPGLTRDEIDWYLGHDETATEVAPGVWKVDQTGFIFGHCDQVRQYAIEHPMLTSTEYFCG